jgi:hypothetical protein
MLGDGMLGTLARGLVGGSDGGVESGAVSVSRALAPSSAGPGADGAGRTEMDGGSDAAGAPTERSEITRTVR